MTSTYPEGKISAALMGRVATIPGDYPTAWPNKSFTRPVDASGEPAAYLEIAHLPNGFGFEPLGSGSFAHQGILQVTLMQPEGGGSVSPQDAAGAIVNHFKKNTKIEGDGVTVSVYSQPAISQTSNDDGYARTPVTIQYQAT